MAGACGPADSTLKIVTLATQHLNKQSIQYGAQLRIPKQFMDVCLRNSSGHTFLAVGCKLALAKRLPMQLWPIQHDFSIYHALPPKAHSLEP